MKNILNMLNKIFAQLLKTVLRFPVATLCSVAMFAVCTAHTGNSSIPTQVINFCLAVIPAFVLAVAARVFAEDASWTGWRRWIDVLAIAVAALMFAFCDPE
ncbi:MAG: hypothetical protein LBS94_01450, partial [Prevotellaceae bacterium]|nr:hypothetical protein [Prevotellaceae bacterium]